MDESAMSVDFSHLDPYLDAHVLDANVLHSFAEPQFPNFDKVCQQDFSLVAPENADNAHNIDNADNTDNAVPSHGQPLRNRRSKATTLRDKDWEPYKQRIIDLHITQNIPLSEVVEIMKTQGLNAT